MSIGILTAIFAPVLIFSDPVIDKVEFSSERYYNQRYSYIPEYSVFEMDTSDGEKWNYNLSLRSDTTLHQTWAGRTYWNNRVHGMSTDRQFRHVGYEFEIGQQFNRHVGVFYYHHSQHVLEMEKEDYPLTDSIGIKICFGGRRCGK